MISQWRCLSTGNPVGTDTRMIGAPCRCQVCRASEEIDRVIERCARIAEEYYTENTVNLNKQGKPYVAGETAIWAVKQIAAAIRKELKQ